MKIKDIYLAEAPLPDDWDSAIYSPHVPFKKRVDYAKQRAEQIGRGSSRVAFIIQYQGRKTVLKIAMNTKGAAQNEAEASLLEDWVVRQTGLAIPLIDYDERSSYPTWIHTEFATKITKQQFLRFSGGASLDDIMKYLREREGKRWFLGDSSKVDTNNEFVADLIDLYGNYSDTIAFEDLVRLANWGVYKNRPVIIDLGATNEVIGNYYK